MSNKQIKVSDGLTIEIIADDFIKIYTRGPAEDEVIILAKEIPYLIKALGKAEFVMLLEDCKAKQQTSLSNWINQKPTNAYASKKVDLIRAIIIGEELGD